jgi:hypothetical protein
MNPPSRKEIPKLSGELWRQAISNHIIKTYDRKIIDDWIDKCERCGSRHIQKRGRRKKIFCTVVLEEGGFKNVIIYRQAYWCVECHHLNVSGKDLFYEGTAYGRPIVDECLALAAHNPANRVERLMLESGIQVDRRTVLRYIKQFKLKIVERYPLKLGDAGKLASGVNLVQALFGKETIEELQQQYSDEKFAAEGDEVYPRVKGALAEHSSLKVLAEALNTAPAPKKEEEKPKPEDNAVAVAAAPIDAQPKTGEKADYNPTAAVASTDAPPKTEEQKKNDAPGNFSVVAAPTATTTNKKKDEENIVKYNKFPSSFTLAVAYISTLKFYVSIICTKMSFNSLLASALFGPLHGVVCALTDGSPIYNHLADDRCLFHYMMNFFKKDPGLENLRRGKPPPVASILAAEYMHDICELVRAEYLSHLMAKHPELVVKDEDGELKYVGPTTTSALEGANHRLKYELRVPYKEQDTFFGRAILAAVKDSMYVFRNGQPEVSFAHMHSSFTFSSVMAATTQMSSQPVCYSNKNNFTSPSNLVATTTAPQPIPV